MSPMPDTDTFICQPAPAGVRAGARPPPPDLQAALAWLEASFGARTDDAASDRELAAERLLAGLGLDADELAELRSQGFVCGERRGRARTIYKLRFRCGGRQRVRCLGGNAESAEPVRRALADLQAAGRLVRELGRLARPLGRSLRGARAALAPLLLARGYHFHGRAVRRVRGAQTEHGSSFVIAFPETSTAERTESHGP